MRTRAEIVSLLTNPGVVAIIRAHQTTPVVPMFESLLAGGVNATEITMTTPNALASIREACQKIGERSLIGVGTVVTPDDCQAAIDAGAEFIVTPIFRAELVKVAHAADRPIMMGAYTPTEAQMAYEAGADFIKIFPAETLGPGYIKALLAPLPHLRLVPTGGIDARNIGEFLNAGCAAVGIGSALATGKILKEGDWRELTRRAKELIAAAKQARKA